MIIRLFYLPSEVNVENDATLTSGNLLITEDDKAIMSFWTLSGMWGKGSIPHGVYKLERTDRLDDIPENKSYKKEGVPWFCRLKPLFKTDRTGLGIHPDGNVKGTLGCLGIRDNDMDLLAYLEEAQINRQEINLYVL